MQYIRSLLFYVAFIAWTTLTAFAGVTLLPFSRRHTLALGQAWSRGVLALLDSMVSIRYEVRGTIPAAPAIVASKHQSSWETFVFPVLLGDPAYVLKRELTRIPLLGRCFVKAGHIAVDRTAGGRALRQLIRAARAASAEGRHVVIFPEGTRTAPGTQGEYHPGVTALYLQLGLQVVPVAVNSGLFWPRRAILKRPGRVVISFLQPIPPGLDRKAFLAELSGRIEAATRSLEAEEERHRSSDRSL